MFDCIRLITSDGWGNPAPGADPRFHGHAVRQSDFAHMTALNQLSDGGRFIHNDCAVAAAVTMCIDRSLPVSVPEVEALFKTSTAGTMLVNLVDGMEQLQLQPRVEHGDPPPGFVMNPLGGRLLPPSVAPAYDAASEHVTIYSDAPLPAATPATAVPKGADVKQWTLFYGPGAPAPAFLSDGTFFEWEADDQALSNRLYVLAKTNPLPVIRWNAADTPVAAPRSFGRPIPGDQQTLDKARECWPNAGL
jgi:hypothetical protein